MTWWDFDSPSVYSLLSELFKTERRFFSKDVVVVEAIRVGVSLSLSFNGKRFVDTVFVKHLKPRFLF